MAIELEVRDNVAVNGTVAFWEGRDHVCSVEKEQAGPLINLLARAGIRLIDQRTKARIYAKT